jgi:hypothetical protein
MKTHPSDHSKRSNPRSRENIGRRSFLKTSLTASLAAPLVMSMEEHRLLAQAQSPPEKTPTPPPIGSMPGGKIGKVNISRLICGGNLISGYAHSRDLIYVSNLLKHYFTDEKIIETWSLCEQHGINTMVATSGDPHAQAVYQKYRKAGGKIQYIAQMNATKEDVKTCVKEAVDAGAVGAYLVGNLGDKWTREGSVGLIGELVQNIKSAGLIAGVAGHELRTPVTVEKAKIAPDFYVKTLHNNNYWSQRRPEQDKEVIDNYSSDNYWCREPKETISFMSELARPWIAYKVLAAGAINPRAGFQYAFDNGADFALVGMFDFQVSENVNITREVLRKVNRDRDWMA